MAINADTQQKIQMIMQQMNVDASTALQLLQDMGELGASPANPNFRPPSFNPAGGQPQVDGLSRDMIMRAAQKATPFGDYVAGKQGGPTTNAPLQSGGPAAPVPAPAPAPVVPGVGGGPAITPPPVTTPRPAEDMRGLLGSPAPAVDPKAAEAAASAPVQATDATKADPTAQTGQTGDQPKPPLGVQGEFSFGQKDDENLRDWTSKVFQNGLMNAGIDLNSATNPGAALNPYNQWVQRRYGSALPVTSFTHFLTNGGTQADNAQQAMGEFAKGGNNGTLSDPMADLKTLNDLDGQLMSNGGQVPEGMDANRSHRILELNNGQAGAQEANALILGAYQQKYGSQGSDMLLKQLNDLQGRYFGTEQPNNTSYLNYVMGKVAGGSLLR